MNGNLKTKVSSSSPEDLGQNQDKAKVGKPSIPGNNPHAKDCPEEQAELTGQILFEGRWFEKSQLSKPQRNGKKIYATYKGTHTLLAKYEHADFAIYGLKYLKRKLSRGQNDGN